MSNFEEYGVFKRNGYTFKGGNNSLKHFGCFLKMGLFFILFRVDRFPEGTGAQEDKQEVINGVSIVKNPPNVSIHLKVTYKLSNNMNRVFA